MRDWRGTEVKVGDIVVYPGRHSSSVWMIEAEVVELLEGGARVRRRREGGYGKTEAVDPKEVKVQGRLLTVIQPVSELYQSEIEIDGRAS